MGAENDRLEKLIREKESKIRESEYLAKRLTARAEQFEELFNGQLEAVKGLQADLATASEENHALVREMEALNSMFVDLERSHVNEALKVRARIASQ